LGGGENNNIVNNIINSNQGRGLNIQWSRNNNVLDNIIESNGEYGIFLFNSNMITISGNLIGSNYLEGININMNYNSFNNSLYHNNIINNEARDDSLANRWYDDTLKEGNYWSDYNGTDDGSGTYKHAIAGDDIGDTNIPYPEEGYDFYPFMNRDGWLTMSVWPHYHDFGKVYQGTLINRTFTITNYGNSPLVISSLLSEQAIISYGIEFPAVIPKGQSQSFNITLDTEQLDGFVLKNIEVVSNDPGNPHKTIAIFGFVEIPASNIIISGVDYQSRVIKGQINLFNVTIENQGDFRERNVSIEFKAGDRSLGSVTINNIEPNENKSAIFKWDTTDVAPKTYDITIEVKLKDKPLPLASLKVPVKVDMPSAAQTLIITNKERLAYYWGPERAEKLENELIKLSYHVSVAGMPVYVEEDKAVAGAYESWDLNPTSPQTANNVVKHIKKSLIDEKLKDYTGVRSIIIVGDDRIIPFYRIPDNTDKPIGDPWFTEDDYKDERGNLLITSSTVGSALSKNKFLTDNFYATDEPMEWKTAGVDIPKLFIPNIPVSRLVETPEQISAVIEAFYREEYVRPEAIFVTGYDFMWDTASHCSSTLKEELKRKPETIVSRKRSGLPPSLLKNATRRLLNADNDVVLVFYHAAHDYFQLRGAERITARDFSTALADLNGSIIYSMSCHAGLNVPPNASTNDFDLVEAFAQKGVVAYVAPTGFGIGSYRIRAAHELLLSYFTDYLCEGKDVGTALTLAKQEYWATNYDFTYIDEKVIETTTLYGLPMARIITPRDATIMIQSIESRIEEQPDTLVIRPKHVLNRTPNGDYYITPSEELLSCLNKPIQPKEIRIFHPTRKRILHGAVLNSSKYNIIDPFKPLIEGYQTSYQTQEPPSGEIPDWFPSRIFKLNVSVQ
jgi:parallel beta-helix repeat protein